MAGLSRDKVCTGCGAGSLAGEDSLLWARRWVAFFAVANVLSALAVFYFFAAADYFAERGYANTIDWGAWGRGAIFVGVVIGALVIYFGLLSHRPWSRWAYLITNAVYLSILIGGHALMGFGGLALVFTNLAIVLVPGMIYLFLSPKVRLLFKGGYPEPR
jgi:hypothetical protein